MKGKAIHMDNEKRKAEKKTPEQLKDKLTEAQKLSMHQAESFGWELRFIREPLFQEPTPVIYRAEGDKIGVLEPDGRIDMKPDIKVRE